jgi:hypothetical protein
MIIERCSHTMVQSGFRGEKVNNYRSVFTLLLFTRSAFGGEGIILLPDCQVIDIAGEITHNGCENESKKR